MSALLLLLALGASSPAQVEELPEEAPLDDYGEGDVEEWSLNELLGSVKAASREKESVFGAPASVTVITREDIRASGARNIPLLLRRVPGVQVYQGSGQGFVVSMRGMSGLQDNNVVVLIDGQPVTDIVDGSVDWGGLAVHLDDIQQIEVVRGPVSTIYGANAYAGVVNIVTIQPEDSGTVAAMIGGGSTVDGQPQAETAVSTAGRFSALRYRVSAHATHDASASQGAEGRDLPDLDAAGGLLTINAALGGGWKLHSRLLGSVSRFDSQDHQAAAPTRLLAPRILGGVELSSEGGKGFVSGGTIWAWGQHSQLLGGEGDVFSKGGTSALAGRLGGELTLVPGFCFRARLGMEAGVESVDAPYLDPTETEDARGLYAAYVVADCQLGEFRLSASARGDLASRGGLQPSYRGAVVYSNEKWLSARLTVGSAFRAPTYVEVLGRFVDPSLDVIVLEGSRSLSPQRITSAELGFVLAPTRGLLLSPVIYAARLDDVISEDFEPLVRKTYANLEQSGGVITMAGAELEARYEWLDAFHPRLAIAALWWPSGGYADPSATAGLSAHNSTFLGSAGFQGSAVEGRLAYGVHAQLATPRTYRVRTGIPPVVVQRDVPMQLFLDASVEYQFFGSIPLWTWLKVQSHLPDGLVEAPLANAAELGTSFMIGVEYRDR